MATLISSTLDDMRCAVGRHPLQALQGSLTDVLSNRLRTDLPDLVVGDACTLGGDGRAPILAQVVGLDQNGATLAPLGPTEGLSPRTRVTPHWRPLSFPCGAGLLGGVYDGLGRPFDGREIVGLTERGIAPRDINPLSRPLVQTPVSTGVRAIDGLLTIGKGQRVGVFGPSGAGKTSLVGALARNFACDVVVLALIGERGREVREFVDRQLPPGARARCIVVASTSDRPAMERVTGAHVATAIAEYFRDQGKHVLLILDSVTRFARALREVGLAAGELAVRRGFPPSVYAELPRLIERTGVTGQGAITAIYSVLAEDETGDDPIVEEVQSITDGHIHLSSRLSQAGHYPAIDVLRSRSRLMSEIVPREHERAAARLRELMAKFVDVEMLLQVGEYRRGEDRLADEAIEKRDAIQEFLRQDARESAPPAASVARLQELARSPRGLE